MAQRRSAHRVRNKGRRRRRRAGGAGGRWMLLLAVAGLAAVAFGLFGSSFPGADAPRGLDMAQARASNAAVPVDRHRRHHARPFRFTGGPAARAQAVDCLATAALYEVGGDLRGQRAVMQVILNRVRRRGFSGTICGVVYQGAGRSTGCQFSFTCDRSFQRRPQHVGWRQARRAARQALAGYVEAEVGRATHYHADWVVPYWRDTLVKVGRVGPHLFYERA